MRLNIIGASFTFAVLLGALIFATYRAVIYHDQLIACYKQQLIDAVTVIPPRDE